MIEFIIFAGVMWLILTIFQPFWVSYSAGREADRKYAVDRYKRTELYKSLLARSQENPLPPVGKIRQQINNRNTKNNRNKRK